MGNKGFAWAATLAIVAIVAVGCGGSSRTRRPGDGDAGPGPGVDTGPGGGGCGGLTECGGMCVDTRYDPANCGMCGFTCAMGEVCNEGTCAGSCGLGTMECAGRCVDTQVDPAHCGGCDAPCAAGEVCRAGMCAFECVGGTTNCGGSCVDTTANRSHCGGCDMPCAAGEACFDGSCGMRPSVDGDGDTISDFDELSSIPRDTDGDGTPDFMDDDSDADGFSDAMEAGDANVMTPPVDSDGDRTPDFQDADSDNDSVSDADERTGGTDPTEADSDGDGESDGVERAGGTNPLDPMSCVSCGGGFFFDLPPRGMDRTDTLEFEPRIQRADVLFVVDTTGSMGSTIMGLQRSLDTLVTDIRREIPDAAFGVARHDDFPIGGYGSSFSGDVPFGLLQRITTVDADVRAGVTALTLHGGSDGPESQIEAFYQAATGAGFRGPTGTVFTPPFMGMTGFDATRGHGLIGGAGYRRDALPIVILATDITFHRKWGDNVRTTSMATWCGDTMADICDEYAMGMFGAAADQQPKTVAETLTALNGIGAKVFGLAVDSGAATSDQRTELSAFAVGTGAFIEPTAGMCPTGVRGAMRAAESWDPDGGGPMAARPLCPLVFSTDRTVVPPAMDVGVGAAVVSAIRNFTRFVSFSTLHTEARDNSMTAGVDESRFFLRGIPVAADPATCGAMPPSVRDRLRGVPPMPGTDGIFDSFTGVTPGCLVTFQVVARNDGFVPATCTDQIFNMRVVVIGDDTVEADSRTVVVRVPGDTSLCP